MTNGNQNSSSGAPEASASANTGVDEPPAALADPIRHAAEIVAGASPDDLERRLKQDIFNSMCRIKPELKAHDFETEIMGGTLFPTLPAPLQGVAIARVEGTLAFYNRVGWHPQFLTDPLETAIEEAEGIDVLKKRYHAKTMHDLAYVHPRHFEKIFGKTGAAKLWEDLKRYFLSLEPVS